MWQANGGNENCCGIVEIIRTINKRATRKWAFHNIGGLMNTPKESFAGVNVLKFNLCGLNMFCRSSRNTFWMSRGCFYGRFQNIYVYSVCWIEIVICISGKLEEKQNEPEFPLE